MIQMWNDVESPLQQKPGTGRARAALLHEPREILWARVFLSAEWWAQGEPACAGGGPG